MIFYINILRFKYPGTLLPLPFQRTSAKKTEQAKIPRPIIKWSAPALLPCGAPDNSSAFGPFTFEPIYRKYTSWTLPSTCHQVSSTCDVKKTTTTLIRVGPELVTAAHTTARKPFPSSNHAAGGFLCAWVGFDFAFDFCGVPSTRTIGHFACAWVLLVVELLAGASASTFTGGTIAPSLRRPLNTLDMLTSRWKTLRGLDSARRSPASCSSETDRERERDCAELLAFTCELLLRSSFVGRSGSWAGLLLLLSTSVSVSESDDDVHCGIRKSFLRKSLY